MIKLSYILDSLYVVWWPQLSRHQPNNDS